MLRISKLADYATLVLVFLANHASQISNAREIARHTALTIPTVSKLLKILTSAGLLVSQRGANGGYCLARPAREISVGEIIKVIEGSRGLTECSVDSGLCALEPVCHVHSNWQLISRAIEAALDSVSIADLAKPGLSVSDVDVSQIRKFTARKVEYGKDESST